LELKRTIHNIISDAPEEATVRSFILFCRKIALVQLRRKERGRRILRDLIHLPVEDIAIDCVADLFQRDESGKFLQLCAYFEGIDCEAMGEEETLGHLRRLVFSKVNFGIFRMYNEADPALGKILRNIKLAIQSLQNFIEVDRFGEHCLVPHLCDRLEHLPGFERQELEQRLRAAGEIDVSVPTLLARLSRILREEDEYCRIVPLTMIAYIFRSMYAMPEAPASRDAEVHELLARADITRTIREICADVKREMSPQYLHRKNVSQPLYDSYFEIVERHLQGRLLNQDGDIHSFLDRLRSLIPGITKEEYRLDHKSRLEYLAHLSYHRAVERFKDEL